MASTIRPLVHSKHLRGRRNRSGHATDYSQDGHTSTWQADKSTHGRSSLASQRKADLGQCRSSTCCASSINTGQVWKPLCENLADTLGVLTEKATNLHEKPQGFPDAGHVLECANVVTVNTRGCLLAKRASGFRCVERKKQSESLLSDFNPFQTHVGRKTEQKCWLNRLNHLDGCTWRK